MSPYQSMQLLLATVAMTRRFGVALGALLEAGDVLCLGGELGAGKTTLTQAICVGAGVGEDEYVSSPTFAIMHEYQARIPIYHMDFYRLNSQDEILDLGLDEYFYRPGITIVEWYEKAGELIPADHLMIRLSCIDDTDRKVHLESSSSRWQSAIAMLGRQFEQH